MPKIGLLLQEPDSAPVLQFIRPDGSVDVIPYVRLITYANFLRQAVPTHAGANIAITKCIIDTGAYISIVPESVWHHLKPRVVTLLPFAPGTPSILKSISIVGGTYPFYLGELPLRLEDSSGGQLDVTIVAKFTRDGGALNIPLTLGLRGGVLDGRILTSQPDPAAPFGEAWRLEDP